MAGGICRQLSLPCQSPSMAMTSSGCVNDRASCCQVVLGGVQAVTIDGEPLARPPFHRLLLLHKPAGCLSTRPRQPDPANPVSTVFGARTLHGRPLQPAAARPPASPGACNSAHPAAQNDDSSHFATQMCLCVATAAQTTFRPSLPTAPSARSAGWIRTPPGCCCSALTAVSRQC